MVAALRAAFAGSAEVTATSAADDGTVDAAATTGVVPVLGPVFFDRAAALADVFEVGAAEVLVLCYV